MDNRPIGMFDSGVGGLTVYKEVKKQLPNESIVYLGDTKRFPYGSKSKESIIELTKQGIDFNKTKCKINSNSLWNSNKSSIRRGEKSILRANNRNNRFYCRIFRRKI